MTKYKDFIGFVEKKGIHGRLEKSLCFVDLTGEKDKISGTANDIDALARVVAFSYGKNFKDHITYYIEDIKENYSDRTHYQFKSKDVFEFEASVREKLDQLKKKNGLNIPEIDQSLYSSEVREQAQELINNFYQKIERMDNSNDRTFTDYQLSVTEKTQLEEGFAPIGKTFLNFNEFDKLVSDLYLKYGIDNDAKPNSRIYSSDKDLRTLDVFVKYLV